MAAAITRSSMCVEPVVPEHMNAVLQKLRDCGCSLEINGRSIQITPGDIVATDITTQPFPGFPDRPPGSIHGPDVNGERHQRDQRKNL